MDRRWPPSRAPLLILLTCLGGCVQLTSHDISKVDRPPTFLKFPEGEGEVQKASHQAEGPGPRIVPEALTTPPASAGALSVPANWTSLDACIRRALDANATVRAARFNVEALRQRVPQVTALDDPVLSNTIYPIPSVAPQYSLMGYMPYSALIAQQFPWFGTLRLRGQAAEKDVQVALFELAAAELDAVAGVKRAYLDLLFNERAEELLLANRRLSEDFLVLAQDRLRTGTATQADIIRAEVALSDLDRELESTRASANEARAELVRLMHLPPDAEFRADPALMVGAAPAELDRLQQLAVAARPDLQGRLAAIARDEVAVELARKRYKPNVTLGVTYSDMEQTNATVGRAADGMPNVGMFVGLNLPIYHGKLAAGVREAQARAAADAALYEAERDQSHRDIKDLFVRARSQRNIADLLRRVNLPAARQVLELTAGDYRAGNAGVDLLVVLSATRDLLQVELQVAQLESELGKTLASLERAVGAALNEHPPDPAAIAPPSDAPGPFRPEEGQVPSRSREGVKR
jgi:outer membrane protein TolC